MGDRPRDLRDIPKDPRHRTKSEVERLRTEGAVFGGCCDRHADYKWCDCMDQAIDDGVADDGVASDGRRYAGPPPPVARPPLPEEVHHPGHYGGADNPYEAIRVIEAWRLGFNLGNAVKYIARSGKKTRSPLTDLRKAAWYLAREIQTLESQNDPISGT